MKAAVYCRYSSENQRAASLEDQGRECRAEAERRGYAVVNVFTDAALSGSLGEDGRPGFAAMMASAKRREFDVLIVDDSSRLSRDTSDALRTLKRLEFLAIGFIARADGIDTVRNARSSRLMFGVKSAFNEEFLRDLAEKTHRGQEGRVRSGFSAGGLPYGYRSQPVTDEHGHVIGHRRTVYEPEAAVVRRIFSEYAAGGSPRQIVASLNEEGVAPPGARWRNKTAVHAATWSYTCIVGHRSLRKGILVNSIYAGRPVWNRSRWTRDPDTGSAHYRVRPRDEWVETEAPELRIISDALWGRVQQRLARNDALRSAPGRRNVGKYLLTGYVRCAVCGGPFAKWNHSYRCSNHINRGDAACTNSRDHRPKTGAGRRRRPTRRTPLARQPGVDHEARAR
jgi:DNA invertase Pin-like site-specific DNA recombinase